MDFFYRSNEWYAGQFIRKICPKFNLSAKSVSFITVVLNGLKKSLLSVLVRDVDKKFLNSIIQLPVKAGKIDFEFMETFIIELEAERMATLDAYLVATGLNDCTLTHDEIKALEEYDSLDFKEFNLIDIFNVKNTGNILSRDIIPNSGSIPYLCASAENNGVSSYISYDEKYLDKGNCVFIGGKTFVVSYQENDFYSNDSHNLVLYLKEEAMRDKYNQLYLATCVNKGLGHKYSWGDSISKTKIQKDTISLPCINDDVDFTKMGILISAVHKLIIKDVVNYTQSK